MAGELTEQEAGLTERRRDHHGEAALQNRPGGLERGHCALAALSRRIEERRGDTESSTSRCQGSRVSPAMRSAQAMGSSSAAD